VHDNNAPGSFGGGIWNSTESATVATVILRSTTVNNNSASDGGGIFNAATGFGPGGTVSLASSPVVNNTPNNCEPLNSIPGCSN
jgi:hypothetical protein